MIEHLMILFFEPSLLLYLTGGMIFGMYAGAIPGISVTMAASLIISFTFSWSPMPAIAAILGTHIGGVYGGSRSAILLNVPGTPASIATTFDGYPLARRGEAAHALTTTAVQSVVGGIIGALLLLLAAPLLTKFALLFAARDYFFLSLLGIFLLSGMTGKSYSKGMFCGFLGMFLGSVGMDQMTAVKRFTFGSIELTSGLAAVAVCFGMFGIAESLNQVSNPENVKVRKQKLDRMKVNWKETAKHLPLTIRCSLIGGIIGALPGTGGNIASIVAYNYAKKNVKNPEVPFGEGAIEGLVAPESSNNAAVGGAYVPMLALGIPGDNTSAILISALYIHGVTPGTTLLTNSPDMYYLIIACILIGNIILLPVSLSGIKIFAKIAEVPKEVLLPLIVVLCVVGGYAINKSEFDVFVVLIAGFFGYLFKRHDFPVGSIILGLILSSLIELNLRRALNAAFLSIPELFLQILTSPLSLILFLSIVLLTVYQIPAVKRGMANRKAKKARD